MSNRYKIRQNLISIGDDFWIENEEGKRVFKVDGKVLRIRKTLVFEDLNGNVMHYSRALVDFPRYDDC